ncbi:MAG: hypothetical protein AAF738_08475, partial [Bacteroidota bacterium]
MRVFTSLLSVLLYVIIAQAQNQDNYTILHERYQLAKSDYNCDAIIPLAYTLRPYYDKAKDTLSLT